MPMGFPWDGFEIPTVLRGCQDHESAVKVNTTDPESDDYPMVFTDRWSRKAYQKLVNEAFDELGNAITDRKKHLEEAMAFYDRIAKYEKKNPLPSSFATSQVSGGRYLLDNGSAISISDKQRNYVVDDDEREEFAYDENSGHQLHWRSSRDEALRKAKRKLIEMLMKEKGKTEEAIVSELKRRVQQDPIEINHHGMITDFGALRNRADMGKDDAAQDEYDEYSQYFKK